MPEFWSQRRCPFLGSGSVNTFLRQPTHVTAATDTHATIEKLLEAVFFVGSVPMLYTDVGSESDLPYVYNHTTKLCRQRAEVIKNHETEHVRGIGQGTVRHGKYKRLNFGSGEAYDRSSD
jgi:hypothetical protein